ncbi:MAG TPA: hypothetical protein DCM87_22545 [Planctomycetes bacterium]|nr:hypothetical protein [Planctomycetota bacterium]
MTAKRRRRKAGLLGLGLDNKDGHTRVTRGENYVLLGGSHETHEEMQETAVKINEKLKGRGKSLDDVSRDELKEIVAEIKPPEPDKG